MPPWTRAAPPRLSGGASDRNHDPLLWTVPRGAPRVLAAGTGVAGVAGVAGCAGLLAGLAGIARDVNDTCVRAAAPHGLSIHVEALLLQRLLQFFGALLHFFGALLQFFGALDALTSGNNGVAGIARAVPDSCATAAPHGLSCSVKALLPLQEGRLRGARVAGVGRGALVVVLGDNGVAGVARTIAAVLLHDSCAAAAPHGLSCGVEALLPLSQDRHQPVLVKRHQPVRNRRRPVGKYVTRVEGLHLPAAPMVI
eukprot:scaffold31826_cov56-Phaeocystis_antarctica.AAC.3